MTMEESLLQDIYERFRASGEWPLVRELQVAQRPLGNIRHLAATIGVERVVCQEGPEGRCFLTLKEIRERANSDADIATFLSTMRLLAKSFAENGPAPVTSDQIGTALGLDRLQLRRLMNILFHTPGPWSGGSLNPANGSFSLEPSEESLFYEAIHSFAEFEETRRKFVEESIDVSRLVNASIYGRRADGSRRIPVKVLLSWSGDPSRRVAEALRDWLPRVIPTATPFMSTEIRKGKPWFDELMTVLGETSFGLFCLVQENQDEPWINFEAGAVAKHVSVSHVATICVGVRPGELRPPLGLFQATEFEKDDMLRLVREICSATVAKFDGPTQRRFEEQWPGLSEAIKAIPVDSELTPIARARAPAARSMAVGNEERLVLHAISKAGGARVPLQDIRLGQAVSEVRLLKALRNLRSGGFIEIFDVVPEGESASLTDIGLEYVVENRLE